MICLVDERISKKCERALNIRGFKVIKLPPSNRLGDAVASHPDMLIFHNNGNIISSAEYCENFPWIFSDIREFSRNARITLTSDVFAKEYPYDAIFNALVIGKYIFLKEDTVSKAVLEYARREGLSPIPTKQGYPACVTLAFNGAAITADCGMARTLESLGIDVTLISNGDVSLPPYEYGFIGGAAGVYNKEVYFLGDVCSHRDFEKINSAILKANCTPVSLSDEPLADLGRIIFID